MISEGRKRVIFLQLCNNAKVCRKRRDVESCATCEHYKTCETQRKINKYLKNKNKNLLDIEKKVLSLH